MTSLSADVDTSKIDFYEFLALPGAQATPSEIKRAGRKTSLLYHPDKVAPTPENLQKFHILQIAIATLSDPTEKAKYDQQREAKLRRKAEVDALDARRRKMREDLETREGGAAPVDGVAGQKRTYSERDMKIKRIQEENRRKMEEVRARKRFEAERDAAEDRAKTTKQAEFQENADTSSGLNGSEPESKETKTNGTSVEVQEGSSIDRSIKLRWVREGPGQAYDEDSIRDALSQSRVEDVLLLKDKKRKQDGRKVLMGTAVVVLASIEDARQLIEGQKGSLLDRFESIDWAKAKDE